jgi:protein farnesyltransferase/geranylgeranyltransferase type-1 subunit alpha
LFELGSDLQKELDFVDDIASGQAKNYQVWHHRLVIVDTLNNCDRELPFINGLLGKKDRGWAYGLTPLPFFFNMIDNGWSNASTYGTKI